ncbi:MAG: hypothetical protein LBR21_01535 [Propionibacteriaceae bacterium]|jgi:hypothetical protein|nr:hypothetical protein [Propionibacteriaceae bacterium]
MATWEDGPEYAPLERPSGFDAAQVEPLAAHEPQTPQLPPAPENPPKWYEPVKDAKPLSEYVPESAPERDGHQPFELATALLTTSGWEAEKLDEVDPKLPLGPAPRAYSATQVLAQNAPGQAAPVAPPVFEATEQSGVYPPSREPAFPVYPPGVFPQPGTPAWFSTQQVPYRPPEPLTLQRVLAAATAGVLIPLALGSMVVQFSTLMFVLAFVLSSRIRYRTRAIRITFGTGAAFVVMALFYSYFADGPDIDWQIQAMNNIAIWVCRIVIWVVIGICWRALYLHERPSKR